MHIVFYVIKQEVRVKLKVRNEVGEPPGGRQVGAFLLSEKIPSSCRQVWPLQTFKLGNMLFTWVSEHRMKCRLKREGGRHRKTG